MTQPPPELLSDLQAAADPRDPRASSLLRAPAPGADLRGCRVLLGVPYDGGIPSRPGARFGPHALREALAAFGTFDGERDIGSITDLGDLSLPPMIGTTAHAQTEEAARRVFSAGARPVFVGGDHGLTGSLIRGLAAARPDLRLALVTIDAHLDVREYEDEASLSSGTPFRRALETSILTGGRTAMIGRRRFANSGHYLRWAHAQGVHIFPLGEVAERGAVAVAREALERVGTEADAIYLSIDLDAADGSVAPGVSAVAPEGLSAREMIGLVRIVAADPRLIGADLMELSPPHDEGSRTARFAARLLLELLSVPPAG